MIEFVGAAAILGLAGSLHCIGMCGPLVTAVNAVNVGRAGWMRRVLYHVGRIIVYATLGAVTGAVGETFVALGFQRWMALAAGILMLLFLAWPAGMKSFKVGPGRAIGWIKMKFSSLLQRKGTATHLMLGMINGLLPCGLVYVALAGSMALTSVWKGALFMTVFGIGTTPSLLAIGSIMQWLGQRIRVRSYRAVQIMLVLVSFIVILRGANLGIPYLSPQLNTEAKKMDCCHKP